MAVLREVLGPRRESYGPRMQGYTALDSLNSSPPFNNSINAYYSDARSGIGTTVTEANGNATLALLLIAADRGRGDQLQHRQPGRQLGGDPADRQSVRLAQRRLCGGHR